MTTTSSQIKIGPEFFSKIKRDYANWRWALVREFLQNCFDAPGCVNVELTVKDDGTDTTLAVTNDGEPMDRDTLETKLLTLGGSGKNFEGENTGGFGVAKSLLYYCHKQYVIHTGKLLVTGSGAQFSIKNHAALDGTKSTIVITGVVTQELVDAARKFASMSQWKGSLVVNGERLSTDLKKGARRKDLGWGVVYTNKSFSNVCVVRINGQPMFTTYCRYDGCVLIELTGKALSTLTSNRDSLKYEYSSELSDLLTALAVDKRSALREQRAEYKRYLGEKLKNDAKQPKKSEQALSDLVDVAALMAAVAAGPATENVPQTTSGIRVVVGTCQDEEAAVSLGHEFIVKNTTGMVTPAYHVPGDEFSIYSKQLVRVWAAVMLKMYQIHGIGGEFSVGFVFDEDSVAEFENGVYGKVYYINPARVVCQKSNPSCRSFACRYTGAWSNRFDILSSAVHEFVHGALNYKEHDENYAGALTETMAKVFEHLKEFTPLFRS